MVGNDGWRDKWMEAWRWGGGGRRDGGGTEGRTEEEGEKD